MESTKVGIMSTMLSGLSSYQKSRSHHRFPSWQIWFLLVTATTFVLTHSQLGFMVLKKSQLQELSLTSGCLDKLTKFKID